MKNSWLSKVVGESLQSAPVAKPSPSTLKQVIGEDEGEVPAEPAPTEPPPTASEEPADGPGAGAAAAEDLEADMGASDNVNSPGKALAALWTSGAKMDVAVKLLSEPVSNRDFVELILAIGDEGGMELGDILDNMQAGAEEEEVPQDAVLNRVSQIQRGRHTSPEEVERQDFREREAEGDPTAIASGEN